MYYINRKIQHFSLLLAVLIIIAHMIIPHDHHLAGTIPGQDDTCPFSKEETGNHEGFPIHCHAFNDLSAEEASTLVFSAYFHFTFDLLNSSTDPFLPDLSINSGGLFEIRGSIPGLYTCSISLLRAPPHTGTHIA